MKNIFSKEIKDDLYGTANIYEAAFLHAKGLKRSKKETVDGKVTMFFEDRNSANTLSIDFYDGLTNNIPAKIYLESLKIIKTWLYQ